MRPAIRVPPYALGNNVQKRDAMLLGDDPGSGPGARWKSIRPGPHLDQNVLGELRCGIPGLDSGPLGWPLFRRPHGPVSGPLPPLAQTWHSKIEIRDENRK